MTEEFEDAAGNLSLSTINELLIVRLKQYCSVYAFISHERRYEVRLEFAQS
jgi:hypothetical protein